ncbi:hypothetical protein J7S19_05715 [Corynebacterium pyruviciproducens]|uniref:hypothetical protein n=1 Tax=Corynebacterium pyruviciproducens TaxID=598660 RepID=UPI0024545D4C|nr:hypothetical protein [Corynebacterium pyruviciproducens]MDH4658110.1 hypothetical protein [Corynebacterium pyruviciproducens]
MLLTRGTANVMVTDAITSNPNWRRQFRKMQALLGPHSTKELTELVRSHVIGLWCEIFGISPADLNSAERLVLRYVSSGMLDILGHVEEFSPTGDVVALARGATIIQQGVQAAIEALDSARNSNRKPQ